MVKPETDRPWFPWWMFLELCWSGGLGIKSLEKPTAENLKNYFRGDSSWKIIIVNHGISWGSCYPGVHFGVHKNWRSPHVALTVILQSCSCLFALSYPAPTSPTDYHVQWREQHRHGTEIHNFKPLGRMIVVGCGLSSLESHIYPFFVQDRHICRLRKI